MDVFLYGMNVYRFIEKNKKKKRFIFVTYLSSEILKLLRKMSVYQIQLCNLHTYKYTLLLHICFLYLKKSLFCSN